MSQELWELETHKEWAECGWQIIDKSRARIRKLLQLRDNDVIDDILCGYEIGDTNEEETFRLLDEAEKNGGEEDGKK